MSLFDNQNLVFVQVQPNEHFGCDMFVSTKAFSLPIRSYKSALGLGIVYVII